MNDPSSPLNDERISAYLDDELSPTERIEFEALITSNAEYSSAVAELSRLSRSMRELPRATLPQDLTERVLRQAEHAMLTSPSHSDPTAKPSAAHPSPFRWQRVVWPVVGLAASLFLVWFILPNQSDDSVLIASKAASPQEPAVDELGDDIAAAAVVDISEVVLQEVLERHANVIGQSVQTMNLRVRDELSSDAPSDQAHAGGRQKQLTYEVTTTTESTPYQCYTIESDAVTMRNIIADVRSQNANFIPVNEPQPALEKSIEGFHDWFAGTNPQGPPEAAESALHAEGKLEVQSPRKMTPSVPPQILGGAEIQGREEVAELDRTGRRSVTRALEDSFEIRAAKDADGTNAADQVRIQLLCPKTRPLATPPQQ